MVGGEDDDRVVELLRGFQCGDQLAQKIVDIGDVGVIAVAGGAEIGVGHRVVSHGRDIIEALAVRIEGASLHARHLGQVDVLVAVEVPEFRARRIRVMRVGEGGHEAEGFFGLEAGVVIDFADGEEGGLVIELKLVGDLGDAGLQHARHVVVPPIDAFLRQVPVRRPAEVSGIDVGGEALLQPVQLVGADEMHLAGQRCAVTGQPEIVRPGGNGGGELGGIVIDAGARRQQAVHHRGAGRRAEGTGGVTVLKYHALGGEAREVGGLHQRVAMKGQRGGGQLVGHDEEDIGFCLCHLVPLYDDRNDHEDPGSRHHQTLSADIIGFDRPALPLFTDMFRLCQRRHCQAWGGPWGGARFCPGVPLPPLGPIGLRSGARGL